MTFQVRGRHYLRTEIHVLASVTLGSVPFLQVPPHNFIVACKVERLRITLFVIIEVGIKQPVLGAIGWTQHPNGTHGRFHLGHLVRPKDLISHSKGRGDVHIGLPARRGRRLLYFNLSCRLLGATDSALASSASTSFLKA